MEKIIRAINVILLGIVCFAASFYFSRNDYKKNFSKDIFESEFNRIAMLSDGANRMVHLPLADNKNNQGAFMCPDALYSAMSYDLTDKPLGIYLPLPESSWAITFYDEDCTAYYSLDERTFGDDNLQIILYSGSQATVKREVAVNIKSPTNKGIVIARLIVPGMKEQPVLAQLRKEIKTGVIKSN